ANHDERQWKGRKEEPQVEPVAKDDVRQVAQEDRRAHQCGGVYGSSEALVRGRARLTPSRVDDEQRCDGETDGWKFSAHQPRRIRAHVWPDVGERKEVAECAVPRRHRTAVEAPLEKG